MEVNVEDPKDLIVALPGKAPMDTPPMVVASLNLKTVINHKHNVNEIASASVVYCKQVQVCALQLNRRINALSDVPIEFRPVIVRCCRPTVVIS
jgi:hypothetical protein